jgi:hypothetical protein
VVDAICSRRPRMDMPVGVLRDRVLFETACVCGARASGVCGMYVEDLDLRLDEHARLRARAAPSAPFCSTTAATSRCSTLPRPGRGHPRSRTR